MAEGPRRKLEDLLSFLREGPPSAFVTEVEVLWSTASNDFARFEVRG